MQRNFGIIVQAGALADIQYIHDYIGLQSPKNADGFIAKLIRAINSLQDFPTRYVVCSGNRRSNRAVRRMPVSPDLIYYRVRSNAKTVDIITIQHEARQQPRRFDLL